MKFFSGVNGQWLKVNSSRSGFALLELLVAVALFGIVTSLVIAAYNRVGDQLFMQTLAYEVALSFRQAQSYGVSVRQFRGKNVQGENVTTFDAAYGLHFQNGEPKQFTLFGDSKSNGNLLRYDGFHETSGCILGSGSECVSVFRLERGNRILRFCGVLLSDTWPAGAKAEECNGANQDTPPCGGLAPPNLCFLDVMFLRPNPDALFATNQSGAAERYKGARIYLVSNQGLAKMVEVLATGQISIK